MPWCLSSSSPAEAWHAAFSRGCGGLGAVGEARTYRSYDLMSAESLSARPRELRHNRRHHDEFEPHGSGAAGVAAMAAAIGGPDASIRPQTAEPQAASGHHVSIAISIECSMRVQSVNEDAVSVCLFHHLPVYCFAHRAFDLPQSTIIYQSTSLPSSLPSTTIYQDLPGRW